MSQRRAYRLAGQKLNTQRRLMVVTAIEEPKLRRRIRDPVRHSLKASQLLGIDVNHVARPRPLITAYRLSWLQVLGSAETQDFEHRTDVGEWRRQHPGDGTQGATLMAAVNGALELQGIQRPPLGAANTELIQKEHGTACAVLNQPIVGSAETDPSLSRQGGGAFTVVNVLTKQPFTAKWCQPSVYVDIPGV